MKSRKISPLNCFVLGKNSNIHGNFNTSYNFCNRFLAKCFETKILWNLERPIITTAPAWRPSLLYRLDCQGGRRQHAHTMQIPNTYFRQQPANQCRDSDCLQYLKSDTAVCKNSFDRMLYTISRCCRKKENSMTEIAQMQGRRNVRWLFVGKHGRRILFKFLC